MVQRVDFAFEANREAIGPPFRVSVDHCFERDFNVELVSGLGLGL